MVRKPGRDLIFAAGLAILAILPALHPGKVPLQRDLANVFWPFRQYLREEMIAGRLPQWNPYLLAGQPFLANPEVAAFYPGTLSFLLSGFAGGYRLFSPVHLAIAMLGLAWLVPGRGRWIAACAWGLSGWMMSRLEFLSHLGGMAWLGVLWLLAWNPGRRPIALGIGLAFSFLTGHPTVALWSWISVFLAAAGGMEKWKENGRAWAKAAVCCLAVSAAQWMPTAEFISRSERRKPFSYTESTTVSTRMQDLPGWIWPVRSLLQGRGLSSADGNTDVSFLRSPAVGPVAVALAVVAVFLGGPWVGTWIRIGLISGIFSLGRNFPLYSFLWAGLPPLQRMRYPAAGLFPAIAAVACLAGRAAGRLPMWACAVLFPLQAAYLVPWGWKKMDLYSVETLSLARPVPSLVPALPFRRILVRRAAEQGPLPERIQNLGMNFPLLARVHSIGGWHPLALAGWGELEGFQPTDLSDRLWRGTLVPNEVREKSVGLILTRGKPDFTDGPPVSVGNRFLAWPVAGRPWLQMDGRVETLRPEKIVLQTKRKAPVWVRMNYYPGWRAYAGGKRLEVKRFDTFWIFMAPPGRVHLVFWNSTLAGGAAIALLAVAFFLLRAVGAPKY